MEETQSIIQKQSRQIEELQRQVRELKKDQGNAIVYKFRKVTDGQARKEVIAYLKKIKCKQRYVDAFSVSQALKIRADQVDDIFEELEKEGRLKDVEPWETQ